MKMISYLFYGLAFTVIAYNFSLKYLFWRDGKYRSWVTVVATILGLIGARAGKGNWWIFLVIVVLDWLPPFLLRNYEERWRTRDRS